MTFIFSALQPEDFWIRAQKKGIVVFALPGEPGLTELVGDFKVHFHDRQGDFYWSVHYHSHYLFSLYKRLYSINAYILQTTNSYHC